MGTGTRVIDFWFFHFSHTVAWMRPNKDDESHIPLHFRVLTGGRDRNWSWKILADRSLVTDYRQYARSRLAIKWSQLFALLRKEERRFMDHRLPALRFTVRMVPADHHYSITCSRFSMHLCYAFPYFHTLKQHEAWWIQGMDIAAMDLAHETTLALEMYGDGGLFPSDGHADVLEAQASLFNMYFVAYLDNRLLAPAVDAVILPPMQYGMQLRGESWPDRRMTIGTQMAALALRNAFGGERLLCRGDTNGLRTYREVLYRALHEPRWLASLRKAAQSSLAWPYPDRSHLLLLLPHGRHIMVPVKDFGWVDGNQASLNAEMWVWSSNYANTAHDLEVDRICNLR